MVGVLTGMANWDYVLKSIVTNISFLFLYGGNNKAGCLGSKLGCLALTERGQVFTWDYRGILEFPNIVEDWSPALVPFKSRKVVQIAACKSNCAVKFDDGKVRVWPIEATQHFTSEKDIERGSWCPFGDTIDETFGEIQMFRPICRTVAQTLGANAQRSELGRHLFHSGWSAESSDK